MIFDVDLRDANSQMLFWLWLKMNAIIWRELTCTWVPRSAAAPWGASVERVHGTDVEPFQAQLRSNEMNLYFTRSPNL